jgi:hypothetical protein
VVLCALDLLDWIVPGLAYAFSWPRLMALQSLALPVAEALLVAWHAHLVWPGARRILDGGIVALLLLGLGLQWGSRQEQQYAFGAPYLAALPPPALRAAAPRPPRGVDRLAAAAQGPAGPPGPQGQRGRQRRGRGRVSQSRAAGPAGARRPRSAMCPASTPGASSGRGRRPVLRPGRKPSTDR